VNEKEDRHQAADMQAVCGRVKANIARDHFSGQQVCGAGMMSWIMPLQVNSSVRFIIVGQWFSEAAKGARSGKIKDSRYFIYNWVFWYNNLNERALDKVSSPRQVRANQLKGFNVHTGARPITGKNDRKSRAN